MPASKIDQQLRSEFKELARSLVARDRHARKFGRSQNTIADIERALVRAYVLGRAEAKNPPKMQSNGSGDMVLDWILVPPRARDVLSSMTLPLSMRWSRPGGEAHKIEWYIDDGRRRWRILRHGPSAPLDHSVADGSVQPLVKLGLLEPSDTETTIFALTPKGLATGKEYWRRADGDDPTLPIISMR
jgi:hypothetical protein